MSTIDSENNGKPVSEAAQPRVGRKLAKKTKAKPVLVASGRRTFSAAETATIRVRLTAAGKSLLKRAKQIKLTAKGIFTPAGGSPVTAMRTFTLKR